MSVEIWAPNSDLVVEAFLGVIFGTTDFVANQRPKDIAKWTDGAFVTFSPLPSGTPSTDLPIRHPAYEIHVWAATASSGSTSPRWGKAFHLADQVFAVCQGRRINSSPFETKSGFGRARVLEALPTSEPEKVVGDPSGFAHVTFDLELAWVVAP